MDRPNCEINMAWLKLVDWLCHCSSAYATNIEQVKLEKLDVIKVCMMLFANP